MNMTYEIEDNTVLGVFIYIVSFIFMLFVLIGLCFLLFVIFIPLGVLAIPFSIYLLIKYPFSIALRFIRIKAKPVQKFKSKEKTIHEIKSIASPKYPVKITEGEESDLKLSFNLADQKWRGVLFKGGIKKDYNFFIKFNEEEKRAYIVETTRTIKWDTSFNPPKASFGFNFFSGIIMIDAEMVKMYDTLQVLKKTADFEYDISGAKWPVIRKLLDNGWEIKPKITVSQLRKIK